MFLGLYRRTVVDNLMCDRMICCLVQIILLNRISWLPKLNFPGPTSSWLTMLLLFETLKSDVINSTVTCTGVQSTLYSTVYTVHYSVRCTVHFTLYSIMYTLQYSVHCTAQFTLLTTVYTVHDSDVSKYSVHYSAVTFDSAVYTVQWRVAKKVKCGFFSPPYSLVQFSAVHCISDRAKNAVLCSAVQCTALHCCAVQISAVIYSWYLPRMAVSRCSSAAGNMIFHIVAGSRIIPTATPLIFPHLPRLEKKMIIPILTSFIFVLL